MGTVSVADCPRCGRAFTAGSDMFCAGCGAALVGVPPAPVATSGVAWLLWGVRWLLALTALGLLWDMMGRPGPDELVAFFERTWGQIING